MCEAGPSKQRSKHNEHCLLHDNCYVRATAARASASQPDTSIVWTNSWIRPTLLRLLLAASVMKLAQHRL